MDESLEEGALRELKEETNMTIYIWSSFIPGRCKQGSAYKDNKCSYMALVDSSNLNIKASDDADDAKWFTVSCNLYQEQKTLTEKGYILQRLYN